LTQKRSLAKVQSLSGKSVQQRKKSLG